MLKNDWTLIRDFIRKIHEKCSTEEDRKREYPRLSSALRNELLLIDTAPKYPHPPRFRLKRSTVTAMARACFGEMMERLPQEYATKSSIDRQLSYIAHRYAGKTIGEIFDDLGLAAPRQSKNLAEMMIVRVFGGTGKMRNVDLFAKIGLQVKSISLNREGKRTEDMKLFPLDFEEMSDAAISFEDSSFHEYFSERPILCIVFQEQGPKTPLADNRFCGFKWLQFDDAFMQDEVKRTWEDIRRLVIFRELKLEYVIDTRTGKPKINKTGEVSSAPNLPKSRDHIVFARGTSSDSTHKPLLVNGLSMYRQQIWIKGSYVIGKLDEVDWI